MHATDLPARPAGHLAAISRLAAAGVLLVVAGAFGAWASVSVEGFDVDATKHGLDGDGAITLVLGLLAAGAVVVARARPVRWPRFALAAAAALVVVIAVVDVLDVAGTGEGVVDVSVGWGLWATLAGGALLLAEAVRRLRA